MPVHARTLKRGDVGEDVAELQRMLTAAGFPVPDIGTYGPVTERMVREYQSRHGLDADGIVGPRTLASLRGEAPPTLPQGVPPSVPAGEPERLIDVSFGSGVPDYRALKALGYTGVIPRLGMGTNAPDALAARQIHDARGADLKVETGYVYLRSSEDGAAQGRHFLDLAARFGLGLWVDIEPREQYDHARGVWPVPTDAPSLYRPVALDCLKVLHANTVAWGVYGAMYLDSLNLPAWVADKPLWVATYGSQPKIPRPWTQAAIWQHAGNVRIAGATVDLNRVLVAGGMAAVVERMRGG